MIINLRFKKKTRTGFSSTFLFVIISVWLLKNQLKTYQHTCVYFLKVDSFSLCPFDVIRYRCYVFRTVLFYILVRNVKLLKFHMKLWFIRTICFYFVVHSVKLTQIKIPRRTHIQIRFITLGINSVCVLILYFNREWMTVCSEGIRWFFKVLFNNFSKLFKLSKVVCK